MSCEIAQHEETRRNKMLLEKKIPVKYLFNKIKVEFIIVTVYVLAVGIMHHIWDMPKVPLAIPGILGTAISLILAFSS